MPFLFPGRDVRPRRRAGLPLTSWQTMVPVEGDLRPWPPAGQPHQGEPLAWTSSWR